MAKTGGKRFLERWLEGRIAKLLAERKQLNVNLLVWEASRIVYRRPLEPREERRLKALIRRIAQRIRNRRRYQKKRIVEVAKKLNVTPEVVEAMYEAEILRPKMKPKQLEQIKRIVELIRKDTGKQSD